MAITSWIRLPCIVKFLSQLMNLQTCHKCKLTLKRFKIFIIFYGSSNNTTFKVVRKLNIVNTLMKPMHIFQYGSCLSSPIAFVLHKLQQERKHYQYYVTRKFLQKQFILHKVHISRKNAIFWDVMPCGSCKNRRFRGI
jgi:hypothetical protein